MHPTRTAAQIAGGFEERYSMALPMQRPGGGQAGTAGAYDRNLHWLRRLIRPRPPPTQTFQASPNLRMGVSEIRWSSTRSEEGSGGKECVSTGRSRWPPND